jgi:redox-sensing transcriptional repressor
MKKNISNAVIKRLPKYFRYLSSLIKLDFTRVSSTELSKRMGITASQIRQDLNCFGGFGQQGYGYNVKHLYNEVSSILGLNTRFKIIILGGGNMGRALANYSNFQKRGFDVKGIFDIKDELIGKKINNIEVLHIDQMEDFIVNNNIDIAALTIPHEKAAELADRAVKAGIKGLWNFSPMELEVTENVITENVHLSDSLMVLGYAINEKFKNDRNK